MSTVNDLYKAGLGMFRRKTAPLLGYEGEQLIFVYPRRTRSPWGLSALSSSEVEGYYRADQRNDGRKQDLQ